MREDPKARLSRLLETDKAEITSDCARAAKRELMRVAAEFFETQDPCAITVKRNKNGYEVTLTFHATRIKNFTALK